MRPALIAVSFSLAALPLCAQMQQDSDLVRAAKAAAAVAKHSKTPLITNESLATSGGHMAIAAESDTATPTANAAKSTTATPSAKAKNAQALSRINVTVGAEHLSRPPAPAYSYGPEAMAPASPAMVSSQAVPTAPPAGGLQTAGTYSPANAGTYVPSTMPTTPMPQSVSKPPGR